MTLPRWSRELLRSILHLTGDAAAVLLAFYLAYELRFSCAWFRELVPMQGEDPGWSHWRGFLLTIVPLWVLFFASICGLYTKNFRNRFDRFLTITQGAFLGTGVTLVAAFLYSRLGYSRLMILLACPFAIATLSISQGIVLWFDGLLASLETSRPMLLVGGGKVSDLVRDTVLSRQPNRQVIELPNVPSPEEILALSKDKNISEVVLVNTNIDRKRVIAVAETCENEKLGFRMIPDLLELRLGEIQMDESLGLPAYRLQHTQMTRTNFAAKRAFDLIFSSTVLILLAPVLILIAILIRIDSTGPALFTQARLGYRGNPFNAFKFRTMVLDAEKKLEDVKRESNNQGGGFFKSKNDPRITAVGKWLRRFSLDELPQFFNVFIGSMSVVGPRPLALKTGEMDLLVENFGSTAKKRVNTMPGITGLWQVSGRSDISAEERFKLDMFYIEHWSLGLDLEIILRTVPAMVSGKGAY
ncbi:MAG: hypothetical protein COB53_02630 [Elusimicrobia bacterium]|nr:MAG: hypothetical protein COB53_02630 [Elusimicrobiota bacterium]